MVTEKAGIVKFVDLIENVTIRERFDEATNKSSSIVLEHKGEEYQPAVAIVDGAEEETMYYLPAGSYLNVQENQAYKSVIFW